METLIETRRTTGERRMRAARRFAAGHVPREGEAPGFSADGRVIRIVLVGMGLVGLLGVTVYAVASVSGWLAPAYLLLVVVILTAPWGQRVAPPASGTTSEAGDSLVDRGDSIRPRRDASSFGRMAFVRLFRAGLAIGRRLRPGPRPHRDADTPEAGDGADPPTIAGQSETDLEAVADPGVSTAESDDSEPETLRVDPAAAAVPKPRKGRARSRKTAKPGAEPVVESAPVTWVRVGPGQYVRSDTLHQGQAPAEAMPPAEVTPAVEAPAPADATTPVEAPAETAVPSPPEAPAFGERNPPTEAMAKVEVPPLLEASVSTEAPTPVEAPAPVEVNVPVWTSVPAVDTSSIEAPALVEDHPLVEAPAPAEDPPAVEAIAPAKATPPIEAPAPVEDRPSVEADAPAEVTPPTEAMPPVEVPPAIEGFAPIEVPTPAEAMPPAEVQAVAMPDDPVTDRPEPATAEPAALIEAPAAHVPEADAPSSEEPAAFAQPETVVPVAPAALTSESEATEDLPAADTPETGPSEPEVIPAVEPVTGEYGIAPSAFGPIASDGLSVVRGPLSVVHRSQADGEGLAENPDSGGSAADPAEPQARRRTKGNGRWTGRLVPRGFFARPTDRELPDAPLRRVVRGPGRPRAVVRGRSMRDPPSGGGARRAPGRRQRVRHPWRARSPPKSD